MDTPCNRQFSELTLEELERSLPLEIQQHERKKMPCPDCRVKIMDVITYEQRLIRCDDSFNKRHIRTYQIVYQNGGLILFNTERHRSLRETLIEANRMLEEVRRETNGRGK